MAKATLVYTPFQQYFDSNGDFLIGGSLSFYAAGTNTLISIYPTANDADASTNALPNPISLDTLGRPSVSNVPVDIYITQAYKLIVKDADGNSLRTVDNVVNLIQTRTVVALNSNYTITVADRDKIFVCSTVGGAITINLPPAATAGMGFVVRIKNNGASTNNITLDGNGSETIDGSTTKVINSLLAYTELTSDGTQWWVTT